MTATRSTCGTRHPGAPPLIQALMRPEAFGRGVPAARLEETHISWVLLTGAHAYKIKKPVKLPFLDFSTLPLRLAACRDELRLNRRFAAELYLELVPIGGSADHPDPGGDGVPFEYAVKMRQFGAGQQLDRLLEAGGLAPSDLEAFGRSLAVLHDSAPRAAAATDHGDPAQVHAPLRESLRDLLEGSAQADLTRELEAIAGWINQRYQALAPVFAARKLAGAVRECHGDLHLGNLVKLDRGVTAFDCIEFSANLRWIDVISDAAFLVMDLTQRGFPELAYAFLNAYLEISGDYAGVRVLHYYAIYRALVRAKVALIRRRGAPAGLNRPDANPCRAYVGQALRWSSAPRPGLILLHGLAGSGKTRSSGEIARRFPAIRLRSDIERKRMHGIAAAERSGSAIGAGIYTPAANEHAYSRLAALARDVLDGGETAIIDAAFLDRGERSRFAALARQLGVAFALVECRAPLPELERRVLARGAEGRDASEAGVAVLHHQLAQRDELDAAERARTVTIDAIQGMSLDAAMVRLRGLLRS